MTTSLYQNNADRIQTIDILRGIALLGILFMNIPIYSLPRIYPDKIVSFEGTHTLNYYAWLVDYVFLHGKMRMLFSMLFGAGIILFTSKKEEDNLKLADAYFRRMLWLLVFALFTSYILIASTEILYEYALCGILLFVFRNARVRWLLIISLVSLTIISVKAGMGFVESKEQLEIAKAAKIELQQGKKITEEQQRAIDFMKNAINPNKKLQDSLYKTDMVLGRSDYGTIFMENKTIRDEIYSVGFYSSFWESFGSIALGMALFKLGLFSGKLKRRTYLWITLIGLGIGLPFAYHLAYVVTRGQLETTLDYFDSRWFSIYHMEQIPRVLCGIGYTGLVVLIYQTGWFKKVMYAFSCLGKMAFTNYMLTNIFCAVLFYGFGLGLYGNFQFYQLHYIVLAMCVMQIIFSVAWLHFFKMGPFEWLWRRLTYGKAFHLNQK
jgi:uncharacterized protein